MLGFVYKCDNSLTIKFKEEVLLYVTTTFDVINEFSPAIGQFEFLTINCKQVTS